MTEPAGRTPAERRTEIASAIATHRRAGSESPVCFLAGSASGDERPRVEYEDREMRVELDAGERERLDALLEAFPVFKLAQPATRKAADGIVYVAAIADPKHAADFVDELFQQVFEKAEDYPLVIERS